MMSFLVKIFIKEKDNISATSVKNAYASLSSIVGIILNLFLCTAKIVIGFLSNSIAISADGFNNLSDAGTSVITLLGFNVAKYGKGKKHPFGHGRFEWIMGIFASIAVIIMGIKLAESSVHAIANPQKPLFSAAVVIVLLLSIFVKGYMYLYNKHFAKITDSETLKATAADCISDSVATLAVLLSTVISHVTDWQVDGYCGVLVSVFIFIAGAKSLWEVLGRIMGRASDKDTIDTILQFVKKYPEIVDVHNLMVHDYGFGYFVVSMQIEGYKKDREQLYIAVNEISYDLYKQFRCDCSIQVEYLIDNQALKKSLICRVEHILQRYSDEIGIEHFRLLESGNYTTVAFDLLYPAELQKNEEEICNTVMEEIEDDNAQIHAIIKSIIRRKRCHACR